MRKLNQQTYYDSILEINNLLSDGQPMPEDLDWASIMKNITNSLISPLQLALAGVTSTGIANPSTGVAPTMDIYDVRFSNAADINDFFIKRTGSDFIEFFKTQIAGKNYWSGVGIRDIDFSRRNFNAVFNQIPSLYNSTNINLFQFLGLVSCMINETGGKFVPVRESSYVSSILSRIKYAYETVIRRKTGNLSKSSYDKKPNKRIGELINDNGFVTHHGRGRNIRINRLRSLDWSSYEFPNFSFNNDEIYLLMQCDVYKFSGLGLIQTTWRTNFQKVAKFVLEYNGINADIIGFKQKWSTYNNLTQLADLTTSEEWEELFKITEVACKAVYIHSQRTNYLNFDSVRDLGSMLNRASNIGYRIGGSSRTRTKVRNRVNQIINKIK